MLVYDMTHLSMRGRKYIFEIHNNFPLKRTSYFTYKDTKTLCSEVLVRASFLKLHKKETN